MPHDADTAIKVATSAGAIFGQCIFGYLGDLLGRKKMYGVELMIIISTTLAQSLCGESSTLSIVGVLIFYRVVMGIGVGGDCEYTPPNSYLNILMRGGTCLWESSFQTSPKLN
jgi:PHS family inorganic phosphate transporter-like MFS transporter